MQRDLAARRGHFRKRRHADGYVITDAVDLHNRLIRMPGQQRSSEMRDHRRYCTAPGIVVRFVSNVGHAVSPWQRLIVMDSRHPPTFPRTFHKNLGASTGYTQRRRSFSLRNKGSLLQSACSQSASMFLKRCRPGFRVAGNSLEGELPGDLRFMSSESVPGRCGLLQHPPSKGDGNSEFQVWGASLGGSIAVLHSLERGT